MITRTTIALAISAATASAQISLMSIDTFDADNEGWFRGDAGNQPTFNAGSSFDGQPGFVSQSSDGGGSSGRFIMISDQSDWTGDYTTAGVTAISLWANVTAGDATEIALAFGGSGGWFHTAGQAIESADGWTQFTFDTSADALTYLTSSGGTQDAADTLQGVTRFQLFAGTVNSYAPRGNRLRPNNTVNTIAFDNITAIPAPTTAATIAAAGLLTVRRRRL